jgi:hypothetical protein
MPTALRDKTQSKTMISTISTQVQSPALKEALALASNKEILVQVLAWDSCGTCSYEPDEILAVKYKREQGTAVYAGCWKLGFVVQYKSDYYAVSEMLVHGKGYQYSTSRHSSFQLAADCLIEQSWTEEENRY